VAVFHHDGEYRAINDFCPHMGASLAEGHFEDGEVMCPWHAWRFCVTDGKWADNPSIKTETYEVRVVGDEIQIKIEAEAPEGDEDDNQASDRDEPQSPSAPEQDPPSDTAANGTG
jgi:nitrite reductase (NADH) small subunit/3-phenylpropionate/trans-cinnamate dioxygenase ferredoxin subunit